MIDIEGVRLPFVPAGGVRSLKNPAQQIKVPDGKSTDFSDIFKKNWKR